MKAIIIIATAVLTIFGCTKKHIKDAGYPLMYNAYFEFLKGDGQLYSTGNIELSYPLKKENNELKPFENSITWTNFPTTTINGKTVFGPLTLGVEVEEKIPYTGQPMFHQYYLLRFNGGDMDTLQISTSYKSNPDNTLRSDRFDIYYNGNKIKTFNAAEYTNSWIITVQK